MDALAEAQAGEAVDPITPSQLGTLSEQLLHVFAGYAFVTSFWVYLPHAWFWWLELALLVGVLIKETVVDPRAEQAEPFIWNGAVDFTMWIPGELLALYLLHLRLALPF